MGSWQVPLLLPEETHSEEATLWAGVAMALSQGLRAHWVERPGRAPEVSPPTLLKMLLEVRGFMVFISFNSDDPVRQPCFIDCSHLTDDEAESKTEAVWLQKLY